MSAVQKLSSQLRTIAQTWPMDPFRPNMQLQTFFISLADHPKLTPAAVRAVQALRRNEVTQKVSRNAFYGTMMSDSRAF